MPDWKWGLTTEGNFAHRADLVRGEDLGDVPVRCGKYCAAGTAARADGPRSDHWCLPQRMACVMDGAAVLGSQPSKRRTPWCRRGFGRRRRAHSLLGRQCRRFSSRLAVWKHQVGFLDGDEPGQHGNVSEVSPATNGSSGTKVVSDYLKPLGVQAHQTGFTDVYPVFVVKTAGSSSTARGRRREQADAIRDEYGSIAAHLNCPASSLPARPSPAQLPGLAVHHFGARLVADLERIDAPLVITLGKEAWATLLGIPQVHALGPSNFDDLYGEGYGTCGSLMINARRVEWLPLVHPGLLKGKAGPDQPPDPARRSAAGWHAFHSRWVERVRHDSQR